MTLRKAISSVAFATLALTAFGLIGCARLPRTRQPNLDFVGSARRRALLRTSSVR